MQHLPSLKTAKSEVGREARVMSAETGKSHSRVLREDALGSGDKPFPYGIEADFVAGLYRRLGEKDV